LVVLVLEGPANRAVDKIKDKTAKKKRRSRSVIGVTITYYQRIIVAPGFAVRGQQNNGDRTEKPPILR
jgi:hypothetical protein